MKPTTAGVATGLFVCALAVARVAGAQEGASAGASAGVSASGTGITGAAQGQSDVAGEPSSDEAKAEERRRALMEGSTLRGTTGLLRTAHADGGRAGQFRLAFSTEFFDAGFLCTPRHPCRDPRTGAPLTSDSMGHFGGTLTLSVAPVDWLEIYGATKAHASSDDANRPALLQVLGDSVLGAKAHFRIVRSLRAGGLLSLWLVNGTGGVGLNGKSTSARIGPIVTFDGRDLKKSLPLRASANFSYVLDNTGRVLDETESARGEPVTRIERYGLGVNRVDHFDAHVGVEGLFAKDKIRPFIDYEMLLPVNRQSYACRLNNPSNDACMANDRIAPSRISIGGRFFPWQSGFSVLAALDIGLGGTRTFVEELSPTPPWMAHIGVGWAVDTTQTSGEPRVIEKIVERRAKGVGLQGRVVEKGHPEVAVARAIIAIKDDPERTRLASGDDGHFEIRDAVGETVTISIEKEGYHAAECVVGGESQPSAADKPAAEEPAPAVPPLTPEAPPAGDGVTVCEIEAMPKVGGLVGHVVDGESGDAVKGAEIVVVDAAGAEQKLSTDDAGNFRAERLAPGEATVRVVSEGFMATSATVTIQVRAEAKVELQVRKRSSDSLVSVEKGEIKLKQQIQFALGQATLLAQSDALLAEIADALVRHPEVKKVEIQGHTDNTGTAERNDALSEARAQSVRSWLVAHGIASGRLVAKGYGPSKPLVPNVTRANRARNRRVQLVILDPAP